MGRPRKDDADYFSHDKNMRNDEKVKALRRKFGYMGYALWCMLLEKLTDSPGFKLKYETEIDRELLAGDFDAEIKDLDSVIEYSVTLGLLKQESGMVYSENLIGRFSALLEYRRRDRDRKAKDSFPHGKPSENAGIPQENATVEYSKGKESEGKEVLLVALERTNSKTLDDRHQEFCNQVKKYAEKYSDDMLEQFIDYWTEKDRGGKKMRFELEKTFEITKRLSRWYRNNWSFQSRQKTPLTLENGFSRGKVA